jgi:hypothetical protein
VRKITAVVAVQVVETGVSSPAPAPLLFEAVTLLLQRQREMDAWVTQQVALARQAADRAEAREAAVSERVARIEERLARLTRSPSPAPAATTNGRYAYVPAHLTVTAPASVPTPRNGYAAPIHAAAEPAMTDSEAAEPATTDLEAENPEVVEPEVVEDAGAPPPIRVAPSGWDLLGPTPAARFGALLIGGGAVAALYGLLMQFGGR